MEASITLKKVGKLIGDKTILAGLSFGIERGSLVAIVGVSMILVSPFFSNYYPVMKILIMDKYLFRVGYGKRRNETRKLIGYVSYENDLDHG